MGFPRRIISVDAEDAMRVNYKTAFKPIDQCGYSAHALGQATDYTFCVAQDMLFTVDQAIRLKLEEMEKKGESRPIKVLELGAGRGGVVKAINAKFNGKVVATGITAFCPDETDPSLMQGNYEFLSEINGIKPNDYDLIFSCRSLTYVSNPALCVLQAIDALKDDGILLIDFLPLWGLTLEQHVLVAMAMQAKFSPIVKAPL